MPRASRFDLAYVPQHIIQRGHEGSECFYSPTDYRSYLVQLLHASSRWECAVHAYVLMPNHVHLLVTPSRVGALAHMMQGIGRNYVSYFNATYHRSGALWEGRYKSCLVGSDYVLSCQCYIELNPVRSGLVGEPSFYPWSSYACNALGMPDPVVVPHAEFVALGNYRDQCMRAYRQLFAGDIEPAVLREIRTYIQQQRALGSSAFQARVEAMLGRCAKARPAHRPRKQPQALEQGR
ncbi:transposase [Dyella flagellata]|uniref:Transposase n=1 Tax=Dyella flagellata TaxID=1867833 RepID=A0ABQ5XET2_9GAMM|nr:transposase [Dyella flagellata]GLQ90190.1 transposase [Dyella flagellata]